MKGNTSFSCNSLTIMMDVLMHRRSDGEPRDTVSSRDSLETQMLLSWSCLGLEPHFLGLGLGLGTYCLGLVPRQDISRQLQLIILSRLKIIPF
jgi:hypothetical protein